MTPSFRTPAASGLTRREMLAQSVLALGALRWTTGCSSGADLSTKPNIILILADSWRGDHAGCNGYSVNVTPAIDRLAESSHVFHRCYSAATWTKPSVASIFTGVLSSVHEAAYMGGWRFGMGDSHTQVLRPCFRTLAEMLKSAGYHTAWFVANPTVLDKFGFARGFDTYELISEPDPSPHLRRAAEWVFPEPREPFFLAIHFINPHYPYIPDDTFMKQIVGQTVYKRLATVPDEEAELLRLYYASKGNVENFADRGEFRVDRFSPAALEAIKTLYDAEIVGVDQQFERLRRLLEYLHILERTLIVVTSDHGEAFGEHGFYHHGHLPYEHQLRVPLLVHLPGQEHRTDTDVPVSLLDLYPTLLAQARVTPPSYVQGRSLFDASGNVSASLGRPVFADRDRGLPGKWDYAMVSRNLKAIRRLDANGMQVFDLAEDPREEQNLLNTSRAQSQDVREAVEHLEDHHAECLKLASEFGPAEWYRMDEQDTTAIEALAYL